MAVFFQCCWLFFGKIFFIVEKVIQRNKLKHRFLFSQFSTEEKRNSLSSTTHEYVFVNHSLPFEWCSWLKWFKSHLVFMHIFFNCIAATRSQVFERMVSLNYSARKRKWQKKKCTAWNMDWFFIAPYIFSKLWYFLSQWKT